MELYCKNDDWTQFQLKSHRSERESTSYDRHSSENVQTKINKWQKCKKTYSQKQPGITFSIETINRVTCDLYPVFIQQKYYEIRSADNTVK